MTTLYQRSVGYATFAFGIGHFIYTKYTIMQRRQQRQQAAEQRQQTCRIDYAFIRGMDRSRDIEFVQSREIERRKIIEHIPKAEQAGKLLQLEKQTGILEAVRAKERADRDSRGWTFRTSF